MKNKFQFMLLALFAALLTGIIYANTYEIVMNKDIAVADSVERIVSHRTIDAAVSDYATKPGANQQETPEVPLQEIEYLEIPVLDIRVGLEEARRIDGAWYQRPSLGGYIGLNRDSKGTIIDYLIYTGASWRTVPDPSKLETGTEIQLVHGGGVSRFKISEKRLVKTDEPMLLASAESRQLLLLIEDVKAGQVFGFSLELDI